MAKTTNKGAQAAKNVAREARKAANPKSLRGQVRAGVMTRAEAVEQATIRRAGVQAAGRRATAGRAVERGVQERAARVVTRRAEQRAVAGMAQRAAGSTMTGRLATAGRALIGNPLTSIQVGAVSSLPAQQEFTKKFGFGAGDLTRDWSSTSNARVNRGKPAAVGGSTGSRTRGGARRASAAPAAPMVDKKPDEVKRKPVTKTAKPAAEKPSAAPVAAAPTRTVTSIAADYFNNPKTQAGEESYAMHKAYLESTKSKPKDIKIGGVAGRTGGKWHLGKRPGKG